jgi:predicted permease
MIPCLLIVLGGELASAGRDALIDLPRRTVAAATGARLALMPALGAAWLATATALRLVPTSQPPLFLVVCLLAWSTPAAVVLSTLAVQHGAAPGVMAGLLLVSYAGGAVTLPLVITLLLGAIR